VKKAVCFVDDDPDEIDRFRKSMKDRYIVGAGVTLEEALAELKQQGIKKPRLFLLDLYYGPQADQRLRAKIAEKDEKLTQAENEVRALLLEAKISHNQGFSLSEEVGKQFRGVPQAFFSRKAFLEDALAAQRRGLPLLEKPDPAVGDKGDIKERYDAAFERSRDQIAEWIDSMIRKNTFWVRYRQYIEGFVMGFFFFLVKVVWDLITK
jgi:hypothetical protein